ncbi:MAG: hypothetical protein KJ649_12670 [Proteobacteria bacterium]|nr:hypothetical protein [Pseudomonadota bacterium]MBU1745730.1 hypothetical protein [Pseudomonadota bacterium]
MGGKGEQMIFPLPQAGQRKCPEKTKRIGYLLAGLGIADDRLREMKRQLGPIRSLIPWILGQVAKDSVNKEWGLIVNGWIRSHGQGRSTFYTIDDALRADETKRDDNN